MSGKCGPTLVAVADAAPDNWTFLGKLRPDEQAVDFFHACKRLGEVAEHAVTTDWYDRATLRDAWRRQGRQYAISATRRRRKRRPRFLSARFFRRHRRRMRYASLKARDYGSGVVREQGTGQPAHETGALER